MPRIASSSFLVQRIRSGKVGCACRPCNEGIMSVPGLKLFLSTVTSEFRSYRDILRNKDEAVQLEQEKREVKTGDVADRLIHCFWIRFRLKR